VPSFDTAIRTLDEGFRDLQRTERIPGVAWGVIRDGALVHAAGAGTIREGEERLPDADSVFRIASMTKSFTAATILLLRDEGKLSLDDEVAVHVPALAGWGGGTADAPAITLRHLLTMSAGMPTDDPWGDRQQPLPIPAFERWLAQGPALAWPTGTTFEYSNLGYGILGRVITAVTGREYREVVEKRILRTLGLDATRYRVEDLPADRVAQGYVRRGEALVPEGMEPYGAFASMGGLFSSVRDLARWVAEFTDAFPARDEPQEDHPLRRATRREMQQVQRLWNATLMPHVVHEPPAVLAGGYGFGLVVTSDAELGTFVWHTGGYPGFGSTMGWHPASGLGVVALGNLRYAPVGRGTLERLRTFVRSAGVPARRPRALPDIERYRGLVEGLLAHWDDALADAAFAMNMDLDQPREERREAVARMAAELGPFRDDGDRPVTATSPADLTWWLRGERGWVQATILLSPEPRPRLQQMKLECVPDPSDALRDAAAQLVAAAQAGLGSWPKGLTAGPDLDIGLVERSLRAASARFGPIRLSLPLAGDGTTTATYEVWPTDAGGGPTARHPLELEIALDAASGAVTTAALRIPAREAPPEGW
jgi:serine-type D-Ala-D-Ala carboxypeptidase/endopeptidase